MQECCCLGFVRTWSSSNQTHYRNGENKVTSHSKHKFIDIKEARFGENSVYGCVCVFVFVWDATFQVQMLDTVLQVTTNE